MRSNPFSRRSRPATSDDQPLAPWHVDTHDDIAMSAIQTSLAVIKEGSSLASELPFIAPIAGLLLQALTMRDEMKQYKVECEIVMVKLARIAGIIVDVCEKYNLSEKELPTTLRNILSSLQRELDRIERVLKKCSKRKGIKGILQRKDLLTRIKQCDVELSNVLQAFQAELGLDIRYALIVQRREAATDYPIEALPSVPPRSSSAQSIEGASDALWIPGWNAREPIVIPGQFGTCSDQSDVNYQPILDRIWAFWRTTKFPREVMIKLPDSVLLNIFRHYLSASEPLQVWPTLTHVCRRWRQIVLTSPLGLHLQLCCTYGTPVLKTLDFWPPFPLVVNYGGSPILDPPAPEDEENIVAALEQSDRVASITLTLTNSLLKKLSTSAGPPSILEELVLLSRDKVQLTLPSALRWGPRLRTLHLTRIAIPTLLQLFSPSRSLVDLQLHEIPDIGYFSPDAFASALSGMTQLETLSLHFLTLPPSRNYPGFPPHPGERVALPALACLKYRGTSWYLDNFVARIDAPRLGDIDITFFNQPTMDASQLGRFIARIEMWVSLSQADVQISAHAISICCSKPGAPTQLKLQISCKQLDWQLSSLTQICKHFSPFLFCVEDLGISSTQSPSERVDIDGEQWLDLIRTFGAAEDFRVAGVHVTDILRALCPANGGHAIDPIVLPVLRNLRVQERALEYGPLWNAAQTFITSRRLSSCPVEVRWLYTYSSYPLESILGPNALRVDTSLDTPYWSPTSFLVQMSGSTPNLMSIPDTYIPAYQPMQGSARTHPAFPTPQVQVTQVPTTPLFPLPYMVQRSETTHTGVLGHLDTTQLTPERYSHYPLQSPGMSHSPALDILYSLSHSEVSGAARTWIPHQRNQDEGIYEDDEEFRDGGTLTKSPPTRSFSSTTRPSRKQTLEYLEREPQMDTYDCRFPGCAAFVRSDVAA